MDQRRHERGRRRERARPPETASTAGYRRLVNPFEPLRILSDDQVEHIHRAALAVLEEIGMRVLLDEARGRFREAGARVDEAERMVRLDRGLVEEMLAQAPASVELTAGAPDRNLTIGGRHLAIAPVGGPPHMSDLERGRRPGTLDDYRDLTRLTQTFDVLHILGPSVEPQDVPSQDRHLDMTLAQLTLSDKFPFVYSRGKRQVEDCFAMLAIARGLDAEAFRGRVHCYTVVNTNSPLQLDIPMSRGIIDFAEGGQLVVVTPFTLAGAMAPVTLAGALTQQHAEAMAGIALSQIVRPGAPVAYGGFTSNVDMRSGAPAFGTPEYVKAALATGQLARRIEVPWRSSNANAANAVDAQAAYESQMSLWGACMGGCNVLIHGAGWLEGGLTASLEKFVIDIEMLQMFAELFRGITVSDAEIGLDAIREVGPGGHYFAAPHTLERYQTAFYSPLVSDWRNFGQWTEAGARDAAQRAHGVARARLAAFEPPAIDPAIAEALSDFVARRKREGGAPPES